MAPGTPLRLGSVKPRGWLRRRLLRWSHATVEALMPYAGRGMRPRPLKLLRELPSLPAFFRRRYASPATPWRAFDASAVPAALHTVPGIRRDQKLERAAFEAEPLHSFFHVYAVTMRWVAPRLWRSWIPVAPRLLRARRAMHLASRRPPAATTSAMPPGALTAAVKAEAARLGLSAIGVAAYDPKYTFSEYAGTHPGNRVITCVLEQAYGTTQLLPSAASEQTALSTYAELMDRITGLSTWIQSQGYRAKGDDQEGESIFIHYAVAAGLGQLGLNGQLLTPQAGSRCRISVIYTDAPLEVDAPVDYGIEGICDRCQVCVRRCPVGAIPGQRRKHRGITKVKLNTKRCFPIVARPRGARSA